MFSVIWNSLPLCICPLVDLLQLIHEILLAPIIWLPIYICRARQIAIACTACPSPWHGNHVLKAFWVRQALACPVIHNAAWIRRASYLISFCPVGQRNSHCSWFAPALLCLDWAPATQAVTAITVVHCVIQWTNPLRHHACCLKSNSMQQQTATILCNESLACKHTLSLSGTVVAAMRLFKSWISGRSVFCFSSMATLSTSSSLRQTSVLPSFLACLCRSKAFQDYCSCLQVWHATGTWHTMSK